MYVGRKVTETRRHEDLLPYTCTSCGFEGGAFVVGVGQGAGNSAFFLDNEGAEQRAGQRAQVAAAKNARLTLSLARCPRCGRRDTQAVTWFWLKFAGMAVGAMLFLWAIGGFIYLLEDDEVLMWIFGPLGPVTAGLIAWMERWKWTTVDLRVHFALGETP